MPDPKPYVEEREFTLRFELSCEFPEDYDGELDGFAWSGEFASMAAEIVRSAIQTVSRHPKWTAHPRNRGAPADREVTLVLKRTA